MLQNHQRCSVVCPSPILAELMAGCCQVLVPRQAGSILPQHPRPLLEQLPSCLLVSLKGRQKKARLIPVAAVWLRKHEVFISLSEPIALPVSIAACETSAAAPSSARSCRAAEGSLSSWLAPLLLCGTKITVQIGPRRNQSSTLLRVAVSRTHMAALFPNHRANEEVPKDLKVNREQRD